MNRLKIFMSLILMMYLGANFFLTCSQNAENRRLREINAQQHNENAVIRAKNAELSEALAVLARDVDETNRIAHDEIQRLAELERRSHTIQTQIRQELRDDRCAKNPIPVSAADRLRDAARLAGGQAGDNPSDGTDPGTTDSADTRPASAG